MDAAPGHGQPRHQLARRESRNWTAAFSSVTHRPVVKRPPSHLSGGGAPCSHTPRGYTFGGTPPGYLSQLSRRLIRWHPARREGKSCGGRELAVRNEFAAPVTQASDQTAQNTMEATQ